MRAGFFLAGALAVTLQGFAQQPTAADMPQEMVWVDRSGRIQGRVGSVQQSIFFPEFSPDERFIAVSARDGEVNDRDVWIHEVSSGKKRQITSVKGNDNFPVWSPDGKRLVFTSSRGGQYRLYLKSVDSNEPETMIHEAEGPVYPRAWSPDGKSVLFTQPGKIGRSMYLLSMAGGYKAETFLQHPTAWHDGGEFSPNGRYLAYASNVAGPWEVYVMSVSQPSKIWKVSRELSAGWAGGGGQPQWRADGKELFYIMGNDTLLSVDVETEGEFAHKEAKRLFALPGMRGNFPEEAPWLRKYEVTADGRRFVFVRTVPR
jgi:Tol biopolymer transport system component